MFRNKRSVILLEWEKIGKNEFYSELSWKRLRMARERMVVRPNGEEEAMHAITCLSDAHDRVMAIAQIATDSDDYIFQEVLKRLQNQGVKRLKPQATLEEQLKFHDMLLIMIRSVKSMDPRPRYEYGTSARNSSRSYKKRDRR